MSNIFRSKYDTHHQQYGYSETTHRALQQQSHSSPLAGVGDAVQEKYISSPSAPVFQQQTPVVSNNNNYPCFMRHFR